MKSTGLRSIYPLERSDDRKLSKSYAGPVFIWDVDKTYLDTRFSKFKDIIAIPFEFAVDKRALPGTIELLRDIRKGVSGRKMNPIYFISASPKQMKQVITKKMTLDGIEYDGITLKDVVSLIKERRFKELKNQLPFKLCALLLQRGTGPENAQEYLFGDDAESDADIYSLYSEVASGKVRGEKLKEMLFSLGTPEKGIDAVMALSGGIKAKKNVKRIYIHLVKKTDPSQYSQFGSILLPCPTPLSMSVDLYLNKLIPLSSVSEVARSLRNEGGLTQDDLTGEWEYLRKRLGIKKNKAVLDAISD